jgi:hypothetical protein
MHRSHRAWWGSHLTFHERRLPAKGAEKEHARLSHPGRRFARSAPQLQSLLGADRIARISEEVTGKRFKRRGNQVQLLPENPDFSPIVRNLKRDSLVIEGIGMGVIGMDRAL